MDIRFLTKEFLLIGIILINLMTFLLYWLDKKRAIRKKSRISEKNLLLMTILFGGIGAWFGMRIFRHKTKNIKFKILVPLFAVLTIISFLYIYYYV